MMQLFPARSPLCAFGTSVLLVYMCGVGFYLWSAHYACRLRNLGDAAPLALSAPRWDVEQRGDYVVLKNYVRGALGGRGGVTFASAATLADLSHVPEVCSRWRGPMSVSVYAPGSDFKRALRKILRLRLADACVHQNVSWHPYFDAQYDPSGGGGPASPEEEAGLASSREGWGEGGGGTFRSHGNLPFPANVGRNVALEQSRTDHVLVADLILYPSARIAPRFLKLLEFEGRSGDRVAYVLPVFRLSWYGPPPDTKGELVRMTAEGNAALPSGNVFPNARKWLEVRSSEDTLSVHYVSREREEFEGWQPHYIASRSLVPRFDEDQVKEGRHDRKLQLFQLCLQRYEFHILDNAFLVEMRQQEEPMKDASVLQKFVRHNNAARERRLEELICRYGSDTGCSL